MSFARDSLKRKEWVPGCGRCRYTFERGSSGRREGGKGYRLSGGGRGYSPLVMLDAMVAENHEDMYCSQPPYDYYAAADFHMFSAGQPPHPAHNHQDMCQATLCTIHGDYGPVTVPMVSTNATPPMPMPVRVPPGHVVQQIVDESGTLRHVILSPTHAPTILPLAAHYGPGNGTGQGPPAQSYYQGLPPPHGYPPPHYGIAMAAGPHTSPPASSGASPPPHGHPQSSSPSASTPPSSASSSASTSSSPPGHQQQQQQVPMAHRDERTQRQYVKLKKKLEQKQHHGMRGQISDERLSPQHQLLSRRDMGNGMSGRRRSREGVSIAANAGDDLSSQQDEEVEGEAGKLLSELLSSTRPPQVSHLEPRSALLHWSQPTIGRETNAGSDGSVMRLPSGSELCYEVLLSEKGKEGKYRLIYSGDSLSCRVEDLKPGTDYWVKLQVRWRRKSLMQTMGGAEGSLGSWEGAGPPSEPTAFSTPPCAPDAPMPPKIITRGRTNLQLRWNASVDNGSHISQYVLEWDQGRQILGGETIGEDDVGPCPELTFTEIYRGRGKQTTLNKLQPSTCYSFRVYAINECGHSDYSEVVQLWTSGSPPAQPPPPTLREARVNSLSLTWDNRKNDGKNYRGRDNADDGSRSGTNLEYTLQMEDPTTGYGFLSVYTGHLTHYTCSGLQRHSEFKFRLKATNDGGPSMWSDEVSYHTLPSPPAAPSRPVLVKPHVGRGKGGSGGHNLQRGKPPESSLTVHASAFSPRKGSQQITTAPSPGVPVAHPLKVKWDPPPDNGGAPIALYTLQVDSGSGFETVFTGLENDYTIKSPIPGTTYRLKVSCSGPGGHGPFSDISTIVADAVPPSCPHPKPRIIQTRSRPTSLSIKWGPPEFNGGAPVTEYEVDMKEDDEDETPDGEIQCTDVDDKRLVADEANGDKKLDGSGDARRRKKRRTVYRGKDLECTAAELLPGRTYAFQVRAYNKAGPGSWSEWVEGVTGAGPPSSPLNLVASPKSYSNVIVQWDEPASLNGAPVSSYRLEMCTGKEDVEESEGVKEEPVFSAIHSGPSRSHEVKGLSPATPYTFRVRAINSAGAGLYSVTCLCCTPPTVPGPFPGPPRLSPLLGSSTNQLSNQHEERPSSRASSSSSSTSSSVALTTSSCHSSAVLAEDLQTVPLASCTSLEIVWDEPACNGSFISQYLIHVSEVGVTGGERILTVPPVLYSVIEDLQPDTAYRIKVQAENSCGVGTFSPVLKACTQPLPPPPPQLECQSSGHAQIRLRWTSAASQTNSLSPSFSASSHDIKYTVQMQNSRTKDFQNVWHGTGLSCKVNRLAEGKSYYFRIAAANLSGRGPFSKAYEFRTSLAPPPTLRPPKCIETSKTGCVLEWQSCRPIGGDPVAYQVQLCRMRDQEYKQVYHGTETKVTLNDLESGAEYGARVCPVRLLGGGSNGELVGSPSPPVKFSTPSASSLSSNGSGSSSSNNGNCSDGTKLLHASQAAVGERKPLTDQQWAAIIVCGFTAFAIAVAFILQQILLWTQREDN